MTTEPSAYEDFCGYTLTVLAEADAICLRVERPDGDGDGATCVDVAFADVRKVTAVMHEKAGLPDRWAALKDIIFCLRPDGMSGEAYRRHVVESMARLEAGQ